MAHPSFTVPDDVLDEFDDEIWELQKQEVLPRGGQRSAIVTAMIEDVLEDGLPEYVAEHPELQQEDESGNPIRMSASAD